MLQLAEPPGNAPSPHLAPIVGLVPGLAQPPLGAGVFSHAALDGGAFPPHQDQGIRWLLDHERALLADATGLGKLVEALGLVAELKTRGDLPRLPGRVGVLVLTDPALLTQGAAEAVRFCPGLVVTTQAHPGIKYPHQGLRDGKFTKAFPDGVDILFAGHRFASSAGRSAQLIGYQPSLVIVDEASALKGGGGDFEAVRAITATVPRAVAMTATALETSPMELWHVLAAIHAPGLPDKDTFTRDVVEWEPGYLMSNGAWVPPRASWYTPGGLSWLRAYLPGVALRRTAEEAALRLPRKVGQEIVWVTLSGPQRAAYEAVKNVSGLWGSNRREDISRRPLADSVVAWLRDRPDVEKAIVYAHHHERLDVLAEQLQAAGIGFARIDGKKTDVERETALGAFESEPEVRVLLGSRVLERGLNLQHARVLLSLDTSWNPAREAQRLGRIRRIGSDHDTVEGVTFLGDTPQTQKKVRQVHKRMSMAAAVGL